MTASAIAQHATLLAKGPIESSVVDSGSTPSRGTRRCVGLKPTMPRTAIVRSLILNHVIHHRAQMGVYLRLNNIPVPSIYGPSADEGQL